MPHPDHSLSSERPVSHFFPPVSLTRAHISTALARSPDNGTSIDLSRRELTDLNEEAAEELGAIGVEGTSEQCLVTRLALSHNRLATLPMGFALLSRLRYLNLKHNSFTVFPDVLTLMPALDTLDISHNKIKRLPSDPGCLTSLRVFVFSRNKVTKIPPYFANFRQLNILKADKNPIQWPPAYIMDLGSDAANSASMKEFISRLQAFLDESNLKTAALSRSMEALLSPQSSTDTHSTGNSSASPWSRFPIDDSMEIGAEETPHARSFSVDSTSVSSVSESLPLRTPPEPHNSDGHPKLHLGILKTYNMAPDSPDSYLPSPADSTFSTNTTEDKSLGSSQASHFRGISYNEKRRSPEPKPTVNDKTSMPDLRTAKLNFTKKVNPLSRLAMDSATRSESGIPSPQSLRQDSGSSSSSQGHPRPQAPSRLTKSSSHGDSTAAAQPVHSVDYERNSYFNRLSMLPVAAISNSLPEPLVHLVDSARTILFTLSQVYQAFDQFTIYTVDDRLPTILRKVLDPASADMMQLICSLDRFDALSRKVVPPPSACRTVVECCRDTVNAFSTALKALSLQLKVLANGKDVRYLRQMLLLLYGATAEISHAWQCLAPHLEAIKPLLHSKPYQTSSSSRSTPLSNNTSYSASEHSFAFGNSFTSSSPPPKARTSSDSNGPPPLPSLRRPNADGPRIRTSRRHAGSFSSKDVEMGKTLPTYDILPTNGFARGVISNTSTPTKSRLARRPGNNAVQPYVKGMSQAGDNSVSWESSHLRGPSHASLSDSSPPIPPRQINIDPAPTGPMSHIDKEALQAVKDAVEVAPAVWEALDGILARGVADIDPSDAQENLDRARAVTLTLRKAVEEMMAGIGVDTRLMREDAHIFLKAVVQLSNLIKAYGTTHSVPSSLRANMVKLTNSTEEFAVLLHVSSFSPSTTSQPRPYSPMMSPLGGSALGPSLSRSRSAQASRPNPVSALGVPNLEPPRSAQPMQTFKLPNVATMRRLRGVAV